MGRRRYADHSQRRRHSGDKIMSETKLIYSEVKDPSQWDKEQQEQAVEHAIQITAKYAKTALESTGGHAMPLAMIMAKQAVAWMLQSGWNQTHVETYIKDSILSITNKSDKPQHVNVGTVATNAPIIH